MEKKHRGTAQKKEAGMMGQRQREQVQRGCAVENVVLLELKNPAEKAED